MVPASTKARAWLESIILTLLFAALIQLCVALVRMAWPMSSQSPPARVVVQISAIAAGELATVAVLAVYLRRRGSSLTSFGLGASGTVVAWVAAILLGMLTAFSGLSNPALHLPSKLHALVDPAPWHLYSAVVVGLTAGFCEELVFRGYIMRQLAAAGHGGVVQVAGSAVLFGVAHAGLLRLGVVAALLVIVPTAMLGAVYSAIVIVGRRSLWPVILSHFINDFAVIPWVFLAVASSRG